MDVVDVDTTQTLVSATISFVMAVIGFFLAKKKGK